MATTTPDATRAIRVRNTTGADQELWLEPLGDRVVLAPGVLYEVSATSALEEIDFATDGFTVYGWVTGVSVVNDDGTKTSVWKMPA